MMSSNDTWLEEEEEVDMDGADRNGVEWEGGVVESDCCDLNYALLRLTVAASMEHMTKKWLEEGNGTEKCIKSV